MNSRSGDGGIRVYFCRNAANAKEIVSTFSQCELGEDVVLEAVPCSGRIDPRYLLKAFEDGTRIACVIACPSGQCKSFEGNLRAIRRIEAVRDLLTQAGMNPDSLQIFMSDGIGDDQLNAAVEKLVKHIRNMQQPALGAIA
jgi:F420-non-reducing hydrogenase iron-sulfur subunit